MIYIIVTTSLFNNSKKRYLQYCIAINKLKKIINNKYKIIIVENNGYRRTFLNTLCNNVFYTNNNNITNVNKGYKELKDIWDCIKKYNIKDSDFIVKITGRYILHNNSNFIKELNNLDNTKYDCLIKYGSFFTPKRYKCKNCITGLIGMRCKYVKQIKLPKYHEWVEWNWAKITYLINDNKICIINKLGVLVCPGTYNYFLL